MKTANPMLLSLALGLGLSGCSPAVLEEELQDHAEDGLVLEAAAVTRDLSPSGVSQRFQVSGGFVRLGVLWDAKDPTALELRTSPDGEAWSAWSRPLLVSSEEGAHVGRLDVLDRAASFYQYRVPSGKAAPTFIVLEPLRSALPPVSTEQSTEDGVGQVAQGVTTISTPIGSLQIHSRADWGGRAPRCSSSTTTARATIHHTVTPTSDTLTPQARLRQIQSYHMDVQGWCDIGYNYLVSRDGRMWRGRGVGVLGSHVGDNNSGNVGISFMGTHTSTTVTATQMCSAAKLLAVLHDEHAALSLSSTDIKGHRQYGGTACPGDALFNQIDNIIRKAARGCNTP